ncbi:MAG: sodium:calcium antiporter [Thermoleophilia bacterium]|nr:sodium:calcium antiporter [Thermoleophilia bacterium]
MFNIVLLLSSFAVLLAGALLFTNAIEWLGHRLELAQGAVGSLLAAVATAMPESLIPIVAIIKAEEGSDEVAIGAIIGAPFMLATIAMALVGVSALAYRRSRRQGSRLDVHFPTLKRDLSFFLVFFGLAFLLGLGAPEALELPLVAALVLAYAGYVAWTLRSGGEVQEEETLNPLYIDLARSRDPALRLVVLQAVIGFAAIIGGAHLFVEEVLVLAERVGIEAIVLSLVLAPLATELPEKANSFFWIREGKDTLALGNITGAMVFQSTLPVAIGLAFTDWELDRFSLGAAGLGLAGGAVAVWALQVRKRFSPGPIAIWGALYAAFVALVVAAG